MIKRDNVFNNRIIFVDGMWGSGKSLLSPLLGLGQGVEKQKMDHNFEYICELNNTLLQMMLKVQSQYLLL